jgi:hypothetical protein
MPTPSHLPAALTADPPIPDDDLEAVADVMHRFAESAALDLETVAAGLIAGDAIDPGVGATAPEIARGYRLADLGGAEWAMRKMREAHEHVAEVEAQAAQWAREVTWWAERESRAAVATATYMAGLLEDYHRRRREEDPKAATTRLPSGVIESTAHKAAVEVTDEEALLAWCQANAPTAVVTVPESYKVPAAAVKVLGTIVEDHVQDGEDGPVATVRSFVTAGGERIPGVAVKAPRLSVRVKPS